MKKLILFLFSLVTYNSYSQDFNFLPQKVNENQIITYTQFTLSYNDKHEQPDWVAYELNEDEVSKKRDRCDCFEKDENVKLGSATLKDYSSTGFDRGHLCPAADNNMSEKANRESFLMSNMSPQLPSFNRGIWADLESWVREKAKHYSKIYVATGPVFMNNLGKIGSNNVTIPGYFYKVILRFDGEKAQSIGFLLPHVGATGEIKDYVVPVNTIESLTGLDFFIDLPNSKENRIESQYYLGKWGL